MSLLWTRAAYGKKHFCKLFAALSLGWGAHPAILVAQTPNPVAAYSMNAGSGTTVTDTSGNALTGTLQGATWTTSGKYSNALSFNGTTAYVDLANPTALRLTGSMTLSAWVFPTVNPPDDGQIIAKSSSSDGWQLKTTPDTGVRTFGIAVANGTDSVQRYSNTVITLNTWYYVAGVYNATAKTLDIYVNGVLDNGILSGTIPATQHNSTVNANIGRRTGGFLFRGTIDEVRVYNAALTQAQIQADMAAPIGVVDTQAPTAPSALTATAASMSQINLSWAASTDNVAVTGYLVERCQTPACSNFAQITSLTGTATTYNDTGLTLSTSYSYRVRATDAAANLSTYSNTATTLTLADSQSPTAPSALTATAASSSQINLSWTASTDNVGVTGYRVERCQTAACSNFAQIASLGAATTTYNDTGLALSTSYSYRVRAADAATNLSTYSNTATTLTLGDSQPPTAPTALAATAAGMSQINLSWTASTDNVAVTGYLVERCQTAACSNFAQIASLSGSTLTYNNISLTPNTSYSYRVRSTDAAANLSTYSNTATTSTLPDTQAPTTPTLTATAASSSQINLSWTASTDNVAVTGYLVERCQNAACSNFVQIAAPASTTYNDTGLTLSTSYSYRVRATDAAANFSLYSNTATASTLADSQAPTVPGSLTATAAGMTQINLAWAASTDNVAVTGYLVERCQNTACSNFAQIASLGSAAASYNDSGLSVNTSYSYRVRATDAAANLSAYSNTATTSTLPDTQAPTTPAALSATAASMTQINLSWTASTDNVAVTGYLVERCQTAACSNFAQIASLSGSTLTYSNTGLTPNTSYSYHVRATDAAANFSTYSNTATTSTLPDTQAPTTPTLTATAASSSQINLSWTASTDNVAVTGYLVERCQTAACSNFAQIASLNGSTTAYNDTGLTLSTSYSYRVRATDAAANLSTYSNTATASTLADSQAPTTPAALTATAAGMTQINLSWTASTDNVAVTGYLVERCQTAACSNFVQIATPSTATYNDSSLSPNTSYSYRVRATDAAANLSTYSNTATTSTLPDTQVPTTPAALSATAASMTQINLSWTGSTDNVAVTGYLVERCQTAACSNFAQIASLSGSTLTYSNISLTPNTSYSYRVRATDAAANFSAYSNTATTSTLADTQAPTAPATLTTTAASISQINLSWTASTDNVAVTGYLLERCQNAACSNFVQIATPSTTTYNDTGLATNTSYSYRVRSTDAAANLSVYSNTASTNTLSSVSGLVTAYPFSEGSGTTTADFSTNGIPGTLQGATWTTSGKYGKALSFNGSTAYVDLGNPTALQLTGSMTLSAWVFATGNPPDDGQIIAKSGNTDGWQLKTTPDTGVRTFGMVVSSGSASAQRTSNTVLSLNTWYHVAGIYNASARTLDLYVNGVLDNGVLGGAIPATQNNSTSNVNIGRRTGGFYFNGTIDEARVYNRALSTAEIVADMNTPIGGAADTQPPTAPAALAATAVSGAQINLSWTASTDNIGVAGYLVERCQGTGCTSFAQVAAPAGVGTAYSDTALAASTPYSYRVRAIDATGNLGPYSNTAGATTTSPDTDPPTAPGTLTATAASGTEIDLVWGAAADNIGVTGYRVERCQGVGCTVFSKFGSTITGTSFNDTGLTTNTSYSYIVRAQDAAGNLGPYTNVATTTTLTTNPQLVSAYSFNEGSGTTVTDLSGNGNTGTVANATWTSSGKYGSGLLFNGTTSQITINDSPSLRLTTGFTLEAWVNPSAVSSAWRDLIYKGDDNYYLEATTTTAGGVPAIGQLVGSTHAETYSPTTLPLNTWTHLAATYDGAVQRLYVNGSEVANHPQTGSITTSANPLQIGGDSIYGQHFAGMIDEVRVYNVALNPSSIQADMAAPLGSATLPLVTLNPGSINFGNQAVGTTSSPSAVTLTNVGGAALNITSIAVTGSQSGDFARTSTCGASLPVNASCTISVTFTPAAVALRSASVTITDNAPGTPHTISLTGTGTGFTINPRTVVLTAAQTQQFTATGPGSGSVTWSVDSVAGGSVNSGTITSSGLYTAPSTAGTHTVTVSNGTISSTGTVYISTNPGMLTHHNNNSRTGQNIQETVLTPANVNSATFGKLLSYPTDGISHASPLYLANVAIPGVGSRNMVYVSTEHDSVFAFDADGFSSTPLWQRSFINLAAGITTVSPTDVAECCDITPEIGITGTPVIDSSTGTLYVVAKTKENGAYVQRLHALNVATGAEKFGGPVLIQASVTGTGVGSAGGNVPFDPHWEGQRTALLLLNGVVYFGCGSHGDNEPYHGWLLGYNATTLQQVLAYNATPNGEGAGIWHSGGGLVTDSTGNIYFVTGDGTFDANTTGGRDYGDSFVKFNAGAVQDYFTPHDEANINANNLDLGAGGLILLPDQAGAHPHLLVGAGKNGTIYLVDRDNLGHFNASANTNVQTLANIFPFGTPLPGNYSSPVYFNGTVYFGPVADTVQAFGLTNGLLTTAPTSRTTASYAYPGGALAISANGNSNGILWAIERRGLSSGTLHAYNAGNLAVELYNSDQAGSRDALDTAAKFSIPLVVNGKVFVASEGRLTVYGLLP